MTQKKTLPLDSKEEQQIPYISASSHPCISLSHMILKGGIILCYLIIPLFTSSLQVLQFLIIAAAVDFWFVKNITGRLLVGLRWWVDFDEEGEEMWKFECKVNEKDLNPADQKIFWGGLLIATLVWAIFLVINLLKIDATQSTVCLFCGLMVGFNLVSYYKCSKVQKENIAKLAAQYGAEATHQFLNGSIISRYI